MTVSAATAAMADALQAFGPEWQNPEVEDIFVVRPGEFFARSGGVTRRHVAPSLDALTVEAIGTFAGHLRGQYADEDKPLLDCEMPSGERLSMVLPPCVPTGQPSLALRRARGDLPNLELLEENGLWDFIKARVDDKKLNLNNSGYNDAVARAKVFIAEKNISGFFRYCVKQRWSIGFVGETGSGKTFDITAIIMEIPATPDERIITIADADEWPNLPHPNRLNLLYTKGGSVSGEMLIEAALRNAPRWLLVQEIRDKMAFAFLRGLIVSPGMSTWHCRDAATAFDALELMVRQHDSGKNIPTEILRKMMQTFINVVVHVERDPVTKKFRATDIKFGIEME